VICQPLERVSKLPEGAPCASQHARSGRSNQWVWCSALCSRVAISSPGGRRDTRPGQTRNSASEAGRAARRLLAKDQAAEVVRVREACIYGAEHPSGGQLAGVVACGAKFLPRLAADLSQGADRATRRPDRRRVLRSRQVPPFRCDRAWRLAACVPECWRPDPIRTTRARTTAVRHARRCRQRLSSSVARHRN